MHQSNHVVLAATRGTIGSDDICDRPPPIMRLGRRAVPVLGGEFVGASITTDQPTTQLYPLARLILTTLISPHLSQLHKAWVTCQHALPKANPDLLAPYTDAGEWPPHTWKRRPCADTIASSHPCAHYLIFRALFTPAASTLLLHSLLDSLQRYLLTMWLPIIDMRASFAGLP